MWGTKGLIMIKRLVLYSLLFCVSSSLTGVQEETFFQTLRTDIGAFIKGNASDEQKERLIQQAGLTLVIVGISLFGAATLGAMLHGEPVPPIQIVPGMGQSIQRNRHSYSQFQSTESTKDLFSERVPQGRVLRGDSAVFPFNFLTRARGATGRRLPTRKKRPKNSAYRFGYTGAAAIS